MIATGLKPAEVRAMTPRALRDFVEGWNEAQKAEKPTAPMTQAEYDELVRNYG